MDAVHTDIKTYTYMLPIESDDRGIAHMTWSKRKKSLVEEFPQEEEFIEYKLNSQQGDT